MERMSVFLFADNEAGYVQAVIVEEDYPVYQKLGFVSSVDDIKAGKKEKPKAAPNGSDNNEG